MTPADPAYLPLNRRRLIAPGPVEISPETLLALAQPQMHHRSPEGKAKFLQAREKLTKLLGDPYEAVIVTGSGTAAFEGALVSMVPEGAQVVNASAGKFSERWGEMAMRLGYAVTEVKKPWGELLDAAEVAAACQGAYALTITHSETSTGALHDLEAICKAVRAVNPDILILADCVTSFGVSELRPAAWGIDVIISGSQKGTATPPGLGYVFFGPSAQARLIKGTSKGFYLDLERELGGQKKGDTPQTPAINLVYALDAALDRLLSVPLEVLWHEKALQAQALVAAGTALGAPAWSVRSSPAVAVLKPSEALVAAGVTGKAVAAQLAKMGQRALPGQAPHEDTVFRISTLGYADRYDALGIAGILEDAFEALGVEFTRGVAVGAAWQAIGSGKVAQ